MLSRTIEMVSTCHPWRPWRGSMRVRVPLADWIGDKGSLTRRLRERCGAQFGVRVVTQGWQRPQRSERRVLRLADGELAWVRIVVLSCGNTPWVVARTVMPRGTLTGRLKYLRRMGNKPLGAVLFSDKTMRREPFEFTVIAGRDALLEQAGAGCDSPGVYGRRAVFRLDGKALLVSEFFLPALRHAA